MYKELTLNTFRVIFHLMKPMYVEDHQRFTLRVANKTIGTGIVAKVLDNQTEDERNYRARKKLMKAEMERLGFNPYGEEMEKKLKPDYTKKATTTTTA